MKLDRSVISYLENFFVSRKGKTTLGGDTWPDTDDTYKLGLSDKRWDTIYARQVIADTFTGSQGTDADTVDGFHAATTPTAGYLIPLGTGAEFPLSVIATHTGNVDAHHAGFVGLLDNSNGNVNPDANDRIKFAQGTGITITPSAGQLSHAVDTGYAFTWTAQHVFDAGLRLNDNDRINFGTDSDQYLYSYDASDIGIHGGLRSLDPNWTSESLGWHISYDGNADFRRIFADELHVRAFIADIEQALAGGQIISKSVAILERDFTAPTSINGTAYLYVEDLPGFFGYQAFQSGDYVRMRYIDRSGGGLVVDDIWGSVTSYVDQGGGYQRWTFTLRDGPITGVKIRKGAIVVDYGTTGQGYWEVTTIDTQYSPYAQVVTWTTNPYTPANRTIRTRMGKLDGLTDPDLTPSGWGLYSDNVFLRGNLAVVDGDVIIDESGIKMFAPTSTLDKNSLLWVQSDSPYIKSGLSGYYFSPDMFVGLTSTNYNTNGRAVVVIRATSNPGASPTNTGIEFRQDQAGVATVQLDVNGSPWITMGTANNYIRTYKSIHKNSASTVNIGEDGNRIDNLYVTNLYATNSDVGGDLTGQRWVYTSDMYINPEPAAGNGTLYIAHRNAGYVANLDVENNITLGGTVDGVDIAGHAGNVNAHHARAHSLTSSSDHTVTGSALDLLGLTSTNTIGLITPSSNPGANELVLKSTATGTLTLQGLTVNGNITTTGTVDGVDVSDFKSAYDTHVGNANAHHNQVHTITGTDHTITASALQIVGATAINTLGLITPSSNPGIAEAVLKSDASGVLTLAGLTATNVTANTTLYVGAAGAYLTASSAGLTTTSATATTELNVGTSGTYFSASSTSVVVNDGGDANLDFRVEGNGSSNLLFVDAGNSRVGIGLDTPAAMLHVLGTTAPQIRVGYDANNYADVSVSSGGVMTIKPTGDLVLDPADKDVLPQWNYDINLGASNKKYLTLHAAELWVETLVAQDTIATIGGRILVGPTTSLTEDTVATTDYMASLNPGFETSGSGTPDVFASWIEDAGSGAITKDLVTVHSGLASCKLAYVTGQSIIYTPNIDVTANDVLTLLFWYRRSGSYAGSYAVWDVTNSAYIVSYTFISQGGDQSGVWYRFIRNFTVPATCDRIAIYFRSSSNSSSDVYIDDVSLVGSEIEVKHNQMVAGDIIYLEAHGSVEFMEVVSAASGSGPYTYSVLRNIDDSGENDWYAGDAVFNTGTTGDGFIDLYSISSVKGGTQYGPTIVGNVRNSGTFNDWSERWAIGNLNGLYNSTNEYGVAFGLPTANYVVMTANKGIEFHNSTTVLAKLSGEEWTLGRIDAGYENLQITASALNFRDGTTVLGSLSGTTWTLGEALKERVVITSSAITMYNNDNTDQITLSGGTIYVGDYGSEPHVRVSSAGIDFYSSSSAIKGSIASTGSFWFGNSSTGTRLEWNTTLSKLSLYSGATETLKFDTTGEATLTGTLSAASGVVTLNSDGIQIGVATDFYDVRAYKFMSGTTKTSATEGYLSSSVNYIKMQAIPVSAHHSNAEVSAQAPTGYTATAYMTVMGNGGLDNHSLTMVANSDYKYTRESGAFQVGTPSLSTSYLWATTGGYAAIQYDLHVGGGVIVGALGANNPGTGQIWLTDSSTQLAKSATASNDSLRITTPSGYAEIGSLNTSWVHFQTDTGGFYFYKNINTAEGIYAGSTSDPGVGNIRYTGALASYKNATTYTGYIFVPLTTPLSSTTWDGDAKSDVATSTELDLYDVFGVPINAKAVAMGITTRDSGTLGTAGLYFACGPTSTYWYSAVCRPIGGDVQVENSCVVPVSMDASNHPTVWYQISASGASTLDVWIYIWGYWI